MTLRNMARMLAILSALSPAAAFSADWVVAKVSQPSRYTLDGKTWQPVTKGITIPNKSWISTGPRGRVVLQRAKDQVTFQPGTMAGVFEKKGLAVHTDFTQQTGTLVLSIDPQKKPHLAVQTPYLAAVVKGTVFTVSVGKKNASVSVDRGRVEVTDTLSGERTGVRAGQKASVDNNPSTSMSMTGKNKNFEPVTHVAVPSVTSTPAAPAADQSSKATDTSAAGTEGNSSSGKGQSSGGSSSQGNSSGNSGRGNDSGDSGSGKGGAGHGNGNSGNGNSGKGDSHSDSGGGRGNSGDGRENGKSGNGHSQDNGKPGKGEPGDGAPGKDKPGKGDAGKNENGKAGNDHSDGNGDGKSEDDHSGGKGNGKGGGKDGGDGEGKGGGKGHGGTKMGGSK